ncbi:hypothetical protein [Burkholderia pseudomallei]|nr:hypothetical protein [Burkholderia pseudomallei]ARL50620.1 hypothetical protein BOC51_12055 [Burkholderia pseudomallei]KGS94365.1 putative phage-encoded membrane protein [Burkholderia pseudomallei MSHR7498]MBO3048223.1 hypothetical protein [Burkholderia pseudomallei]MDE3324761.1 hypothetical protein [Burkholderia pseudomallei]OMR98615.1 hypothetical protein AQ734_14285 [Burkholderia pseudomallei]
MMNNISELNALLNLLGVAALLALLYGPIQSFIVDTVRQRFFEIRDGVFDAAAKGEIAFDDPHYVKFRASMNGLLRNAHECTIWRMVTLSIVGVKLFGKPSESDLNPFAEAPDFIKQAHQRATIWLGVLMWLRSPILIVLSMLGVLVIPVILIAATTSATARRLPLKLISTLQKDLRRDAALEVMLSR